MKDIKNLCVTEHYSFNSKDDYIFMDVNTLDIYILDEIDNEIIKVLIKAHENKCLNTLIAKYGDLVIMNKINELYATGIIKKSVINKKENARNSICDKDDPESINAIDIFISDTCNLACKYCFVYKDSSHYRSDLMKLEVGEKAIDFLLKKSGKKKNLFVCFFGGEPLINFRVLKRIVIYALKEGVRNNKYFNFSITTNGTLFSDEIVEFIAEYKIQVLISIDGDKFSQNLNRPLSDGGESYSGIVNNLKKLDRRNISYSARATVSSLTKNRIFNNYEHLNSLGFKRIRFENAFAPEGEMFINRRNDIEEIKDQYSLISKRVNHFIRSKKYYNLETLPLPMERIATKSPGFYSCTAGKGFVAVDVNGDIYLCHRFVRNGEFYMGNVVNNTFDIKWPKIIINEMSVENRRKCGKCWARYICGGGCYAINYEFNSDIFLAPKIYCSLMKYTIKQALTIYITAIRQRGNFH